jgi:hypothetical protein
LPSWLFEQNPADITILKNMYSSLPIPSDQIPDIIESSIAKELDPLFNYRPTGVPDAVMQGL